MVGTAQTALRAGRVDVLSGRWAQREYIDHQGNPVVLGKFIQHDEEFTQPKGRARYTVQIYSVIPIQENDYEKLHNYLSETGPPDAPKFEIYSYCPRNAISCVEHQRHEIAYRKRLHAEAEAAEKSTEALPPLIPMAEKLRQSRDRVGFCLFLTSGSFRADPIKKNYAVMGTGPQWIHFDRRISSGLSGIPIIERLEGFGVHPELWELEVIAKNHQRCVGSDIRWATTRICHGGELDYGLDQDEGQLVPSLLDDPGHIMETLTQQMQGLPLDALHLSRGPGSETVTVTNAASDFSEECNLQYIVYVPFLGNIQNPADLLETTARLFTASIVANLPAIKTVRFEFCVPDSTSVSSILPKHPQPLQVPQFTSGALQNLNLMQSQRVRVLPLDHKDQVYDKQRLLDPCRLFAVVLDRPSFITEPGVMFLQVTSEYPPPPERPANGSGFGDGHWMEVRRSAGMPEVARRLAMLAVEECQGGHADTSRVLSREEYSAM